MELQSTSVFKKMVCQPAGRPNTGESEPVYAGLAKVIPEITEASAQESLEMRIDFGPGFRVYDVQRGDVIVVLLCGGDKSTPSRDIERAKELASQLELE